MTYEQAYADHEFLWSIASAADMTGGYVDQDDLARMLKTPTKATAKYCLCQQIEYWFMRGTEQHGSADDVIARFPEHAARIEEIRERHNS